MRIDQQQYRKKVLSAGSSNIPLFYFSGITGDYTETLVKSGASEAHSIRAPEIFEIDANTWGQLYMQRANTGVAGRVGIAYATAPKSDPHNWTKQGRIIDSDSEGWDTAIASATIFKESGVWYVYYGDAIAGTLGLAYGADLASLTKYASNPIVDNTAGSGFNKISRHPEWGGKIGSTYYLFYEGRVGPDATEYETGEITYATSTDLFNWTLSNIKVMESANYTEGFFKKMSMADITKINDTYVMFVLMSDPTNVEPFGRGGGIGYGVSTDLVNWTLVTQKMWLIYLRAQCGNWMSVRQEPSLMVTDSAYYLYLNGGVSNGYIELAVGAFDDTLESPVFQDDFNDNSFDTDKWSKTELEGKTVEESGGVLKIKADGSEDAAASTVVLSGDATYAWNDYASFSLSFIFNNVDKNTGYKEFAFMNAARSYGWQIILSNTTDTVVFRIKNNGANINQNIDITQGDRIKFVKNQCNVSIWLWDGTEWARENELADASGWAGQSFFIQSAIANVLGDTMELDIDDVVLYAFDHNLESVYDL